VSAPTRSMTPCAIPGTPLADASAGIDACVHCGFCLQACPTYLTLEDENDSPRGRIVLMHALVEGTLAVTDRDVRTHIDRCLGCRACETACPSGVPYGQLLEATRATLTARQPNAPIARAILFAFARPALLSLAMWSGRIARALGISRLLSRLPGRFGFAMGKAFERTGETISTMVSGFFKILGGDTPGDALGGPLMMYRVASVSGNQCWDSFLLMLALISINLGLINLLPIPMLDGGHLLVFALEAARRRPLSTRIRERVQLAGLIVVGLITVLALRNDITRYLLR